MAAYFLLLAIAVGISFFFLGKKPIRKRQARNIRSAEKMLGLLASFTGKKREARILKYLRLIDPFVFEELLLTAFERKGYEVKRNGRYTGDGGVDGRVYLGGDLYLIQAKRYKSYVNGRHLEDFLRLIEKTKEAKGGYFIHTGKTGKITYWLYHESALKIISGDKLIDLILPSGNNLKKAETASRILVTQNKTTSK